MCVIGISIWYIVAYLHLTTAQTRCCMPAQWESPIGIIEGYYLPSSDSSGGIEGVDRISYDFLNKRLAGTMTVQTDGKYVSRVSSLTDFTQKKQYTTIGGRCSVSDIMGEALLTNWECIPENANFSGKTYFGGGNNRIEIEKWRYEVKGMVVEMTYATPSCIPLTEAVLGSISSEVSGIVLVTYTGLTLGIRDTSVFNPPPNCTHTGHIIDIGSGTVGGIVGRMKRHLVST